LAGAGWLRHLELKIHRRVVAHRCIFLAQQSSLLPAESEWNHRYRPTGRKREPPAGVRRAGRKKGDKGGMYDVGWERGSRDAAGGGRRPVARREGEPGGSFGLADRTSLRDRGGTVTGVIGQRHSNDRPKCTWRARSRADMPHDVKSWNGRDLWP